MQDIVEASPGQEAVFEITGQVFVYRGHNFLLATHAPQLLTYQPPAPTPVEEDDGTGQGDSVEDIMQELMESVGPIRRSAAAGSDRPDVSNEDLLGEGTTILARRGKLTRSDFGAWIFVFDADAAGLADPPLVIMPCLMLQRLETYGRSTGRTAPILLSGRVFRYGRRNYVLPSAFRIPRQRTPLSR